MKATELMIGNWVKFKVNKTPNTIESINFSGVCTLDKIGVVMVDGLKPIPLTEEWLIKFGFSSGKMGWKSIKYFTDCNECTEEITISYNLESKRLAIFDSIEETDMVNILSYPIYCAKPLKHVHQLQNLYFALTNEELTIK